MNIKQIEEILIQGGIEFNEAKIEAKMLVRHFLGLSDIDLILDPEFDDKKGYEIALKAQFRAESKTPIQHIIGSAYFMGEDYFVDKNVLIPRDETEILVRKVIEIINQKSEAIKNASEINVLDIGVGSGCISCSVAKFAGANVLGIDISENALLTAKRNVEKFSLENLVELRQSDVFSSIFEGEKFDIIVSNPPYIPPSEKGKLYKELDYEPQSALFATDFDGVEFYDKISLQAPKFIKKGGSLIFELGIGQSQIVKKLMEKSGFKNIGIEKDLAGIDRIIWGEING